MNAGTAYHQQGVGRSLRECRSGYGQTAGERDGAAIERRHPYLVRAAADFIVGGGERLKRAGDVDRLRLRINQDQDLASHWPILPDRHAFCQPFPARSAWPCAGTISRTKPLLSPAAAIAARWRRPQATADRQC